MHQNFKEIKEDKEERQGETGKVSEVKAETKSLMKGARDSQCSEHENKFQEGSTIQHGVNCNLERFFKYRMS